MNEINLEDCRDTMSRMADNSVDSIVTDPPYELGFMGKDWDNTGIAYDVDMWAECLRVLKPGGYLMAFSATRTYHRMAVAIEDAGFEIRDMIEWVYGSGFPKSLNIGKAVDKLQGNEREDLGAGNDKGRTQTFGGSEPIPTRLTKGTSEYEGWGTALKPAHEPICMARKPLSEKTVAENVLKWGTGGINIDESRVSNIGYTGGGKNKGVAFGITGDGTIKHERCDGSKGRFPANLIHDNSEEVRGCFPETKSGSGNKNTGNRKGIFGELGKGNGDGIGGDSGNACRFFKYIPGSYECITCDGEGFINNHNRSLDCDVSTCPKCKGNGFIVEPEYNTKYFKSIIYQAKASKSERGETNNHPTVKPIALMEYLIKMVTKPNGIVYDPFGGSGTTACACILNGYSYILSEMKANHVEIIKARTEHYKQQHTQATLF